MRPGLRAAAALTRQGASVTVAESQANRFQPDIAFRGFSASALLGHSRSQRIPAHASYAFLNATFRDPFTVASPNHPAADDGDIRVEAGDRLPLTPKQTLKSSGTLRFTDAR